MSMHYTDPSRAADAYALPDVEVFYRTAAAIRTDGWCDDDGAPMGAGWYYWFCLPGCLPDSEPIGPFDSEAAALADARESAGVDDDVEDPAQDGAQ